MSQNMQSIVVALVTLVTLFWQPIGAYAAHIGAVLAQRLPDNRLFALRAIAEQAVTHAEQLMRAANSAEQIAPDARKDTARATFTALAAHLPFKVSDAVRDALIESAVSHLPPSGISGAPLAQATIVATPSAPTPDPTPGTANVTPALDSANSAV